MATEKALQLVTLTLADLLRDRMQRSDVAFSFSRPLSPTGDTTPSARLNLYLYQVLENPAFRNEEDPAQAIPGKYGSPPLALSLNYLLTSYGKPTEVSVPTGAAPFTSDSLIDLDAQYILADAMRVLHDVPIVSRTTPRLKAGPPLIMDPGLQSDFESIRLVQKQLSLDELTKVWTAFKEDFQRSVGYEVTIVRIQRPRQAVANGPVLRRRISVTPSISPAMVITLSTAAAAADTNVYFTGAGLDDPTLSIQVTDAARLGFPASPVSLTPQVDANHARFFQIPSSNPQLQPGPKLVQAVLTSPAPTVRPVASAPVPLTLLPQITHISPLNGPFDGATDVTITGTALGVAPADPEGTPSPMVPAVLFGGYVIPLEDLDLSGLPVKIIATLNAQPATSPQPPSGMSPVPVRVRVNGVENQSWQLDPVTGHFEFVPGLRFTPS
ncbi:MAG TPA: Pvc16 family protein [Gemmatimonadaceae bacterium]|jgi:hypothetical protein|nr:Pvc16 family protein [Gemmatimonadaceae bacterium]